MEKIDNIFDFLKTICHTQEAFDEQTDNQLILYLDKLSYKDLDKFIYISLKQGVLPVIYKNLQYIYKSNRNQKISDLLQLIKPYYINIAKKNILLSSELISISKILAKKNITFISFKGPTLSQIAYGDITMRQYGDIDILVHKKDFQYISDILKDKGFQPLYPIETFIDNKVMFEMNNDCPFYDTKRKISIEVHWAFFRKLALPTYLFKPWDNIQSTNINNFTLNTLNNETYLVYHIIHASKHIWERLEWIVDVDRFIRTNPTLNWDLMIMMAKRLGALKMFLLGIYLAKQYFHTPIPKHINTLCNNIDFTDITIFIEDEFHKNNPSPEDSLTKLIKVIQLRDNLYYKVLTLLEFIFRPGINERRMIILSDKWFWLYWIIRPFGMTYRFIFNKLSIIFKS